MSSDLVLVSGANGFLGTEVTLAYLAKGFNVRGTVRSQDKVAAFEKKHGNFEGRLTWTIVPDISVPGAFDEAIKGVTIVAHTASPFHYAPKDNEKDMLIPAQAGTREMMESAHKEKSVKRVVVTSSFASVLDPTKLPAIGTTYSGDDWNPSTYEEAAKSDSKPFVYCASKKLGEEAAWDFVKANHPTFSLSTICPPMITGPPQQVIESMSSLNQSTGVVWDLVDATEIPATGFPVFVDVRDVAELHVLATTEDVARGQRYLTIADHFDNSQIADILRRNFPAQAHRIPTGPVSSGPEHFGSDSSKVQKELGIKWTSFEKSVIDTARALFEIEASLKA